MKVHNVQQGTPEWQALRASYFTASEAPAMMGASKYQTRTELLAQKKTGITPEVDAATQRLFDRGHATEALARPLVEAIIGDELFPIVGTEGNLLASMDGATMLCDTLFEHKLWNESLVAQVRAGELEPHYYWQMEQQLLVSGADRVIFVCSDGTPENFVHMEYRAVPGRREKLLAGWAQFEQELAEFVPQEAKVEVIGTAPESLPALRIEVTGMVTASNLDAFKAHAFGVIGAIKTDLQTDQDFADADKTVKWLKDDVEDRLEAAKRHALSQTATIDELFKAIDQIAEQARAKRLELDKLVKARKQSIREDIVMDAAKALQVHVDQINGTLGGKVRLPRIPADFAGVIKGKKTIDSLRDATNTELARAKIEANRIADGIRANLASLNELAKAHAFLFHDAQDLVLKANDDLVALIKVRISEHDESERKRREAEAEAQRQAEQPVKQPEPVAQVAEAPAPAQVEQTPAVVEQQAAPVELVAQPEPVAQVAEAPAPAQVEQTPAVVEQQAAPVELVAQPEPVAQPAPVATQATDCGQRIKLGDIGSRLGFTLTADFLRSLGFEPVDRDRSAMLYRASDFPRICAALVAHIQAVQSAQAAA